MTTLRSDLLDKPSPARMYDYFLGGFHNAEIDRLAAERMISIYPDSRMVALANRACLRRMVEFLVHAGINQFLDLGSGIPTVGNVHAVAQAINPDVRTVYVDIDPVAVAHSLDILQGTPLTTTIQADAQQPETILKHPEVLKLIDFQQPVAVLMLVLLPYIRDNAVAHATIQAFRATMAPGSYLAITHAVYDNAPPEIMAQLEQLMAGSTQSVQIRTYADIVGFFDGMTLIEPGVVYLPLWRPDNPDAPYQQQPERLMLVAGMGQKTG